jgi:hypothetical protein
MLLLIPMVTHSYCQDSTKNDFKIGIGVALFNIADLEYFYYPDASQTIHVPIDFNKRYRIEPYLGFSISSVQGQFSVGIGAFRKFSKPKFHTYTGFRSGYAIDGIITIAPTVGGEYFFIENFSIGSEIQLRAYFTEDETSVHTNALILVRFYF